MEIINYLASLEFGWLLRVQLTLIFLLIIGAVTSQWGKHIRVRCSNWFTISMVSTCLAYMFSIQNTTKAKGAEGADVYNFITTHIVRCVVYFFLMFLLTRRLIKTCRAERVRKARFDILSAGRKKRFNSEHTS